MVTERLNDWIRLSGTNALPTSILYYRDGVSSGHYSKVKEKELIAIRTAYQKIAVKMRSAQTVLITAVVVTKRHHTRFFPVTEVDHDRFGNKNTKPGLFVDKLVTSPYYQDFFLQSHSAIKGTAKPTHYFVLEDGIKALSIEVLRELASIPYTTISRLRTLTSNQTHAICYSYARATVGVSYASPAYYADSLCERARLYMRKYFVKGTDKAFDTSITASLDALKVDGKQYSRNRINAEFPADAERTDEVKKQIRDDEQLYRKQMLTRLRNKVFDEFKREFERFADRSNDTGLNPWHPSLGDTMFWM